LKTPNISSASGLYGIFVNSGNSVKLYYNTVRLNAVSSGTVFGSSALYTSTASTNVYCANNIFINNSTPVGTGLTMAYQRNGTSLTNFTAPTDNNIYYAGSPGPSNLIFFDGVNAIQTLSAYQTHVAPFEANSKTENTTFISTTGGAPGFLHIDPTTSSLSDNGATNISGIIDDIDGDIRAGNPGYTGTGYAPDIGADEYEPVLPPCSGSPNAGTVTASNNLLCNGGSAVLTNTSASTGAGITYQWQVSNTGVSGPYSSIPSATLLSYTTPTLSPGIYHYQLVVTCAASALSSTTTPISVTVNPNPTISVVSSNTLSCSGSNITLTASGANTYTWNTGATTNTLIDNPTSTTTYTVDGTDANGCTASVTFTQNVVSNPTITSVNVTDATSPGCANGSATVNVSGGTSPYIYTWNPNVSSSNIATNLNGTSGTGTSYTVTVVDVNSCSSVYTFTVDCVTGIESIQVNSGIAIYPNPTNGQFNVVFDANLGEQMEMELTDVTGKTVLHIISREAVTPVNISDLANGIYFYTIKVDGVKVRGKVVKE
jgi:hypothetical protein